MAALPPTFLRMSTPQGVGLMDSVKRITSLQDLNIHGGILSKRLLPKAGRSITKCGLGVQTIGLMGHVGSFIIVVLETAVMVVM